MSDSPKRREYASLEDALRHFPWWPTANLDVIRQIAAEIEIVRIYTPPRSGYIGLVPEDGGPIVSIHSGYMAGLRNELGKRYWKELPVNRIREGDSVQIGNADGDPCPECGIVLPVSHVITASNPTSEFRNSLESEFEAGGVSRFDPYHLPIEMDRQ